MATPLETAAQRAYDAFLKSLPDPYRPFAPPWENLPEVVREAWKAAAAAARESR